MRRGSRRQPVQVVAPDRLDLMVELWNMTPTAVVVLAVAVAVDELCPALAARVEIPAGLDLAPMVAAVVLEVAVVM
jgi:hypothetical protein